MALSLLLAGVPACLTGDHACGSGGHDPAAEACAAAGDDRVAPDAPDAGERPHATPDGARDTTAAHAHYPCHGIPGGLAAVAWIPLAAPPGAPLPAAAAAVWRDSAAGAPDQPPRPLA